LRAARQAAGELRTELHRTGIKVTALVADGITGQVQFEQSSSREMLQVARLLREAGWADVGVFLSRRRSEGREAAADRAGRRSADDDLERLVRELDRVVAPAALADHLHRRWSKLTVEVFDPTAGRFSAGFGLWLSGLSGLWTMRAHRPTAPHQPFDYASPADWPLLMPFPGRPAPTLRLVAIREGRIDHAYVMLLTDLIRQSQAAPEALEKAKLVLDTARRELSDPSQEKTRTPKEGDAVKQPAATRPGPHQHDPPTSLMDRHRRALFDQIVELTRGR
jgi:hypothetical protein